LQLLQLKSYDLEFVLNHLESTDEATDLLLNQMRKALTETMVVNSNAGAVVMEVTPGMLKCGKLTG